MIALRSATRVLLLAVLAAGVPGCAWLSSVNPFADDDDELGPMPLLDFEAEGRVRDQWRVSVGSGLGDRYTPLVPAVVNGVVYAADAYGLVEARDLASGDRLWQTRIGTPEGGFLSALVFWSRDDDGGSFVTGGVAADDYAVFIGTQNGDLVALRAEDGGELWRTRLSSEILAPAASDDERVYVSTLDGRLTALSRSDGARLWSYDTQVPVLTLRGSGRPVVSEPLVFIGFANGRLTALRAEDGSAVWEHVVAQPGGRSELDRMADIDGAPLITPQGAFVASYQGALKSLRLADGNVQWERPISAYDSPAEGYGQVYVTNEDGALLAVDQISGTVVWQQDALLRRGVTGPAVFGPYLAVGDFEGYVHVFAQADGRPIARFRVDSDGIRSAPVGVGDELLVLGNGGRLGLYTLQLIN
ncbi:MAG TPA: outer membrane protein assembly factor BamB [Pseudomonadales bacterium]|nr:outer membrane protein assembly factor BamB [Pseudomonadales bacterium]